MSDAGIDKLKSHFVQAETKLKAERTGKAVSKHVVNLYSTGVSKIVKIDSIDQLRKDIDEDPIIRDYMAEVGTLLVEKYGRYLAPLPVLAHTANRSEGFVENVMQVENEQGSDHTLVGDSKINKISEEIYKCDDGGDIVVGKRELEYTFYH